MKTALSSLCKYLPQQERGSTTHVYQVREDNQAYPRCSDSDKHTEFKRPAAVSVVALAARVAPDGH